VSDSEAHFRLQGERQFFEWRKKMNKHKIGTRTCLSYLGAIALLVPTALAQGTVTIGSSLLPQLAFGAGWYSALYFTNLNSSTVSFAVNFISDTGAPLSVPALGGSSAQVSIAAHGTAILEAPNSGSLVEGYATFTLPSGVVGYGVFRQSVPGIPDQEAVVPFSSSSASTTLTFDETSFTTGVAIVNPSATAVSVNISTWDSKGNSIGTAAVSLSPYNKTETALSSLPGLAGMTGNRGSAQFSVTGGALAVLGLRFNGSAFTSIPPSSPSSASAPLVSSFQAGQYVGPSTLLSGQAVINVAGPGVTDNGATEWSLSTASSANGCTFPLSANWFVGSNANNPIGARLTKAGITSAAWSYGVASGPGCGISGVKGGAWNPNTLIGVSQIGKSITIVSFTLSGADSSTPQDQVTFTLGTPATFPGAAASAFQAGTYVGPGTMYSGKAVITVSGPGASDSGTTEWALSSANGANGCTFPNSATWYTGQIANSPYATRLKTAGITSNALSYGVGGGPGCGTSGVVSGAWNPDTLIGVSQDGNTITISSFTLSGTDSSIPVDQITFTLSQ
jgi:hypothetical protein